MTLLAPLTALVAAALALPALALLYLLKLRRRPVRVTSTLLWQRAHEDLEANVPWKRISPSWLLLFHFLLVCLVILALGRPALTTGGPAPNTVVFVIDRSASMNAADGQGPPGTTRLDEAKRRARIIVEDSMRLGRRIESAVVAVAAEPLVLSPLTDDRSLLLKTIDAIAHTDQTLDLASALKVVEAMLGGTRGRDTDDPGSQSTKTDRATGTGSDTPASAPTVVILSDGAIPPGEPLSIAGANVSFERVGPQINAPLIPVDVQTPSTDRAANTPANQPAAADRSTLADFSLATAARLIDADNVGILSLNARRDAENPAVVRVFARLANASTRVRDLAASIALSGIEQRRAIRIPGSTSAELGEATLTFEIQTRDAGVLTLALDIDDLLAADNRASLYIAAPAAPSILLVTPPAPDIGSTTLESNATASVLAPDPDAPNPGEPSPDASRATPESDADSLTPDWLLESILSELRPASLRRVTSDQATPLIASASGVFDLIVFDRVEPAEPPPVPSISLGAGMRDFGVVLAPALNDASLRTPILTWDRAHPLLRDVTLDAVFTSGSPGFVLVDEIVITSTDDSADDIRPASRTRSNDRDDPPAKPAMPTRASPPHTVLASGASGPMIVLVESSGRRHVFASIDLSRSNWGLQLGFPIFLSNAVDHLTLRARDAAGRSYSTADAVELRVPAMLETVRLRHRSSAGAALVGSERPGTDRRERTDETTLEFRVPPRPGDPVERSISLGRLDRVGVYRVDAPGVDPPVVAVNLTDPAETSLATSDTLRINATTATATRPGQSMPRDISRWILAAVAVLLALEWIAFAAAARK